MKRILLYLFAIIILIFITGCEDIAQIAEIETDEILVQTFETESPSEKMPAEEPMIIEFIEQIGESKPEKPAIEIYRVYRRAYQVLGLENKMTNGTVANWGDCWGNFFGAGMDNEIAPFQAETAFLGIFCQSEPGYYNYFIGAVVTGVDEVPDGMFLEEFPESEYIIITHEWLDSAGAAENQIGCLVSYSIKNYVPDGYEEYGDPIMFIERYNNNTDKGSRCEVWKPIRPKT